MAVSVQMPKQGNTVEECLLVEWRVRQGERVKQGEVLCAIETDKAAFEVTATAGGVVLKLLAAEGELVPVLTDIAIIGEAGETLAAAAAAGRVAASGPGAAVSPRARALAGRLGIDAACLPGSGIDGRVTARDVTAAVASGAAARTSPLAREVMAATGMAAGAGTGLGGLRLAADLVAAGANAADSASAADAADAAGNTGAAAPAGKITKPAGRTAGQAESVPYKGIRKLIGERMRASLMNHAQLTLTTSADAAGLLALRKIHKEKAEAAGLPNISLNDMVSWVVARTLPDFPEVNGVFDADAGVLTRFRCAHLAVAVDTPRGLMVPVVRDAHTLSMAELSRAIARLAADCQKGAVNPDNLTGGTFTVSNLGSFGVESFTPILNPPQVGILGVCAITNAAETGPGGTVVLRPRLGLSLTIDHQVVDGAPAARFLQALAKGIGGIH